MWYEDFTELFGFSMERGICCRIVIHTHTHTPLWTRRLFNITSKKRATVQYRIYCTVLHCTLNFKEI